MVGKKDWRAQGRQDGGGLHEKKGEEAKKIVGEPQSRNQRQADLENSIECMR